MVSKEDILGERERKEVGVEGMEDEEREYVDGNDSLNLAADAKVGDDALLCSGDMPAFNGDCKM